MYETVSKMLCYFVYSRLAVDCTAVRKEQKDYEGDIKCTYLIRYLFSDILGRQQMAIDLVSNLHRYPKEATVHHQSIGIERHQVPGIWNRMSYQSENDGYQLKWWRVGDVRVCERNDEDIL